MKYKVSVMAAVVLAFLAPPASAELSAKDSQPTRPNFLVIVADDMGFSDLGAFGGEISTPNLDSLANRGIRLANFHVAPTCSPTRAMLLTGRDQHTVGLGLMAEIPIPGPRPAGHEGYLTTRETIATRLRDAGYTTLIAGKWHLGDQPGRWPEDRGFDRSYVLHQGGGNHFGLDQLEPAVSSPLGNTFSHDGEWTHYPVGAYSADEFTNRMLGFLRDNDAKDQPFFAYLAFTQPHWPLQAHAAVIQHYRSMYDDGPRALEQSRRERMAALGFAIDTDDASLVEGEDWQSLPQDERDRAATEMEVYAAMIEEMDRNVGRVIAELDRAGELESTVIIFMSDNGASGSSFSEVRSIYTNLGTDPSVLASLDTASSAPSAIGAPDSFAVYGSQWSQAAMSPSRLYKGFTNEGGIRSAAFVSGPGIQGGTISDTLLSVRDIYPTLLDLAGVAHEADSTDGGARSWLPMISGSATRIRNPNEILAMGFNGRRMIARADGWKAIYSAPASRGLHRGAPVWQLYNLNEDP
ncbi:MAG: sulfatase-like hydrolase/transferase, partial [Sphingomonadaceae bacterium]